MAAATASRTRSSGTPARSKSSPAFPPIGTRKKVLPGLAKTLQANPDIDLIFPSADLLIPSLIAVLRARDKYKKAGEPEDVTHGSFDGDATAYQMLVDASWTPTASTRWTSTAPRQSGSHGP